MGLCEKQRRQLDWLCVLLEKRGLPADLERVELIKKQWWP
jgi:hypothetical protein